MHCRGTGGKFFCLVFLRCHPRHLSYLSRCWTCCYSTCPTGHPPVGGRYIYLPCRSSCPSNNEGVWFGAAPVFGILFGSKSRTIATGGTHTVHVWVIFGEGRALSPDNKVLSVCTTISSQVKATLSLETPSRCYSTCSEESNARQPTVLGHHACQLLQ